MSEYNMEISENEMLDEEGIMQEAIESEHEQKIDSDMLAKLEGKTIYRIKMSHSNATEFCICPDELTVQPLDLVIVPAKYGRDLGIVQGVIRNRLEIGNNSVLVLQRKATETDQKQFEENEEKSKKAFRLCRDKIFEHKLDMKLISAHYLLDEPKILFFFTADSRVDFRELVKDLVAVFKMRIELRQIGVRDETRVLGGLGMCGRVFCCNSITDKLKPVSIKMAKEQNLSLNSLKISGACGRLLCCLAYEFSFYKEMKSGLPNLGEKINYKNTDYSVSDINIFKQMITLVRPNEDNLHIAFTRLTRDERTRKWSILEVKEPDAKSEE
jgi:cell fate regulator YaaT (PSP1 superfamily)